MEKFSSHQAKKKFIVALGIVSFALQYVWENLQYGPFFNASTTYMAVGMFIAALGDVAMTFIAGHILHHWTGNTSFTHIHIMRIVIIIMETCQ